MKTNLRIGSLIAVFVSLMLLPCVVWAEGEEESVDEDDSAFAESFYSQHGADNGRERHNRSSFSPMPMFVQTMGSGIATSMIVVTGVVVLAMVSEAELSDSLSEGIGWAAVIPMGFAPQIGATVGTSGVGRLLYGQGHDHLLITFLSSLAGSMVGLAAGSRWMSTDDDPDEFLVTYYLSGGVGSVVTALIGYHVAESMGLDASDKPADSRLRTDLGIRPTQTVGQADDTGLMLEWTSRF